MCAYVCVCECCTQLSKGKVYWYQYNMDMMYVQRINIWGLVACTKNLMHEHAEDQSYGTMLVLLHMWHNCL